MSINLENCQINGTMTYTPVVRERVRVSGGTVRINGEQVETDTSHVVSLGDVVQYSGCGDFKVEELK